MYSTLILEGTVSLMSVCLGSSCVLFSSPCNLYRSNEEVHVTAAAEGHVLLGALRKIYSAKLQCNGPDTV